MRVRKLLKLKLKNLDTNENFDESFSKVAITEEEKMKFGTILDEEYEFEFVVDVESIDHVAGYCVHTVVKNIKKKGSCDICIQRFAEGEKGDLDESLYQQYLQRGGLWIANEFARTIVTEGVVLVEKLITGEHKMDFLRTKNQKVILQFLLMNSANSIFETDEICSNENCKNLSSKIAQSFHFKSF